ncbi:MAG: hypothetical protein HFI38_14150 [Lachnospiraceae bacterium]|jgi:hypothetical protein|nr:hypothetical protein [Lachnospiraceae bacterium]
MKCDSCGAPVENGKCTYCGKSFENSGSEKQFNETVRVNNTVNSYTQPQLQPKPKPKIPFWKKTWFVVLICVFMPYIGVFLLWAAKKPLNIFARIIITIVLVFYLKGVFASINEEESGNQNENKSVWSEYYTDIDDFEYYIDGNEIFLTDYNSNQKKVRINSSYEIDGNTYNVVSLDGVFTLDKVTSVIIPEGVRSVAANEFNGCKVKFLYLPSTLEDIGRDSFWGYFHDVEKIYYGGSEEQWNQLCTVERAEVEVKQIIYDANPDDLK